MEYHDQLGTSIKFVGSYDGIFLMSALVLSVVVRRKGSYTGLPYKYEFKTAHWRMSLVDSTFMPTSVVTVINSCEYCNK